MRLEAPALPAYLGNASRSGAVIMTNSDNGYKIVIPVLERLHINPGVFKIPVEPVNQVTFHKMGACWRNTTIRVAGPGASRSANLLRHG